MSTERYKYLVWYLKFNYAMKLNKTCYYAEYFVLRQFTYYWNGGNLGTIKIKNYNRADNLFICCYSLQERYIIRSEMISLGFRNLMDICIEQGNEASDILVQIQA